MPAETKKRKLNADGKVARASGSSSVAKDKTDIKTALRDCNAANFVQALSNSLDEMPDDTIRMLKATIIPLARPDNTPKHCVRCHKSYSEASNTIKSCVINCTKPEETDIPDQTSDRPWEYFMWKFRCCGRLVDNDEYCDDDNGYSSEDSDAPEDSDGSEDPDGSSADQYSSKQVDVCYTAKHTTDPESVKYFSSWGEKKREKGLDYSGRNKNVRTCKMRGCIKEKPKKKS